MERDSCSRIRCLSQSTRKRGCELRFGESPSLFSLCLWDRRCCSSLNTSAARRWCKFGNSFGPARSARLRLALSADIRTFGCPRFARGPLSGLLAKGGRSDVRVSLCRSDVRSLSDREGAGEIYASGKPKDQPSVSIVVLRGLTFLVSRCLAGNALAEEAQRPKTVAPLTDIVINIISRQRLGKKEEAQRPKAVASLTS